MLTISGRQVKNGERTKGVKGIERRGNITTEGKWTKINASSPLWAIIPHDDQGMSSGKSNTMNSIVYIKDLVKVKISKVNLIDPSSILTISKVPSHIVVGPLSFPSLLLHAHT